MAVSRLVQSLRSRLAQKLTLWVFVSLMAIEIVVLVPSYYRKRADLLTQREEISAAAAKSIPLLHAQGLPDAEILTAVEQLQANLSRNNETYILGGALYRDDFELVGTFGEAPELTLDPSQGMLMMRVRQPDGDRYDVSWPLLETGAPFMLVVRHDTSGLQQDLTLYASGLAGLVLIIATVVTLATMLGVEYLVLRTILALRQDLLAVGDAIQAETPTCNFASFACTQNDELGEVVAAFREMYNRVITEIRERKQAAQALQRSEQELRLSFRRESALNQLSSQIRQSLDLDTVLVTAVESMRELLAVDRCQFMWLCDAAGQLYYGDDGAVDDDGAAGDRAMNPLVWQVVQEAKAAEFPSVLGAYPVPGDYPDGATRDQRLQTLSLVRVDQLEHCAATEITGIWHKPDWAAMLAVPVRTVSGAIGLLQCAYVHGERQWTDLEVELIQAVADQLAIALSQSELYQQSRDAQASAENLLLNILPRDIANRLQHEPHPIADRFESVTILFADIVDFTGLAAGTTPTDLVELLNRIFSTFDQLADRYGLEKIKTIGDAYMVVGGLPHPRPDHAAAVADMAIAMQAAMSQFQRADGQPFGLRIGISTGPVVAGVIGLRKFIYDLWGDAVNTASRMESHGLVGGIQVTEETYRLLQEQFEFSDRGEIQIKGKGTMRTYLLLGTKVPQAA